MRKDYFSYADSTNELKEKHEENNANILKIVKQFQESNNLKPEDFVIAGSSCGSYMDYFILDHVKDVDIIIIGDNINIIELKRDKVDFIIENSIPEQHRHEYVLKDGYYFVCAEDLLFHSMAFSLSRIHTKIKSFDYIYYLLKHIGITLDEYLPKFKEILESVDFYPQRTKDEINRNLYLLKAFIENKESPEE